MRTQTRREELYEISGTAFICICPLAVIINGALFQVETSFFWEQSHILEKIWIIFIFTSFPIVMWFVIKPWTSDSYERFAFWGNVIYLISLLTPILIALLKYLA